jgi:hypothetical protein
MGCIPDAIKYFEEDCRNGGRMERGEGRLEVRKDEIRRDDK